MSKLSQLMKGNGNAHTRGSAFDNTPLHEQHGGADRSRERFRESIRSRFANITPEQRRRLAELDARRDAQLEEEARA